MTITLVVMNIKNMRTVELMVQEGIQNTIRKLLPKRNIKEAVRDI